MVSGLAIPWDLTWVGNTMLCDLRAGALYSKVGSAAPQKVSIPTPPVYAHNEIGMLGIVADPAAATNNRFYTCQAVAKANGDPLDIEVLRWKLVNNTTAQSTGSPLITGLPLTSGRHSGCRLRFRPDGDLYVGTGDAATGVNPQSSRCWAGRCCG